MAAAKTEDGRPHEHSLALRAPDDERQGSFSVPAMAMLSATRLVICTLALGGIVNSAPVLARRRLVEAGDPFIDILSASGITLGLHDAHGNLIVPTPSPTMQAGCTMTPAMFARCTAAGGCCKPPAMCGFGCPKAAPPPHPVPTPYTGHRYFRADGTERGRADKLPVPAPAPQYRAPRYAPAPQYQAPAPAPAAAAGGGAQASIAALTAQIAALKASLGG